LEFNKHDIIQEEPFDGVLLQDTYGYLIAASVMGGKKAMFSVCWELNSMENTSLESDGISSKRQTLQFQEVRWHTFIHSKRRTVGKAPCLLVV